MRTLFFACVAPFFLLPLGACGSSPSASSSPPPPHFAADDAGNAEAASEGGSPLVDAGYPDGLMEPVCTSVPTGPTGTVTTQGSPGFPIVSGGAWAYAGETPTYDGGTQPMQELYIILSDQVSSCVVGGRVLTRVTKANERWLGFNLFVPGNGSLPPAGTYSLSPGDGGSALLELDVGTVSANCYDLDFGTLQADTQATLTLTEVAADHVKGTYSVMLPEPVSGTFDVPMCPPVQVQQSCCAL